MTINSVMEIYSGNSVMNYFVIHRAEYDEIISVNCLMTPELLDYINSPNRKRYKEKIGNDTIIFWY